MSLSPYSRAQTPFPSLAFSSVMNNPFKSGLSSPSTSSSADFALSPLSSRSSTSSNLSLSPSNMSPQTPSCSLSSSSFVSCSHPDWPKRTILSPLASFCGSQASSYITDEDLLALSEFDLHEEIIAEEESEISWEETKQAPLVLDTLPAVAKRVPPKAPKRRRSDPMKRRKLQLGISPIPESPR